MENFQKHIVYLGFDEGVHHEENIFSILSLLRFCPTPNDEYRITVYTNHPEYYEGLGVSVEFLDPDRLEDWAGPNAHPMRRKTCALRHALTMHPVPTLGIDGDTYFLRHPDNLFSRIKPGHAIMHILEGSVSDIGAVGFVGCSVADRLGRTWNISEDAPMWNGGVEGLHPLDIGVLDDVLLLMDAVFAPERWTAEQFSTGYMLSQSLIVHPCDDVVFHYWADVLRKPFRERMSDFMPRYAGLPLQERIQACYAQRPKITLARHAGKMAREVLMHFGYSRKGWFPRFSG